MQQSRADRSPRNGRQSGSSHVAASTTDKPAKAARHRERVHIGTSGWHYKHWVGSFYPEGMQDVAFLGWYADHFPTVEINNTFYRLPDPETPAGWSAGTPPGFVFACKASRYITHMKKLKDPKDATARFFGTAKKLGGKLGPILFQLPPRWRANAARLAEFLGALPSSHRYAFEFRDESWYTPEIFRLLERHGAALCIHDLEGLASPVEATAPFTYIRLHGPDGAYRGRYDDETLQTWARRIHRWRRAGLDIYCYFNNDIGGHAPRDAMRLAEALGTKPATPGRASKPSRSKAAGDPSPARRQRTRPKASTQRRAHSQKSTAASSSRR